MKNEKSSAERQQFERCFKMKRIADTVAKESVKTLYLLFPISEKFKIRMKLSACRRFGKEICFALCLKDKSNAI